VPIAGAWIGYTDNERGCMVFERRVDECAFGEIRPGTCNSAEGLMQLAMRRFLTVFSALFLFFSVYFFSCADLT
jgi:hypothetical protein